MSQLFASKIATKTHCKCNAAKTAMISPNPRISPFTFLHNVVAPGSISNTITMVAIIDTCHTVSRTSRVAVAKALSAPVIPSPAGLPRKSGTMQLGVTSTVHEGGSAVQGNMVEAPVPDGGKRHAVGAEGHDGSDDGSSEQVVPMMEFTATSQLWLCRDGRRGTYSMLRAPAIRHAPRRGM
jgi:hypothetical protein